ncbi:expressed unknown protein [Seminavis robusta]|uniref:Uncharacterized protein n=1 Tax=Seminavis robusta TaxID=568900 RepID=A0A9N8E690_9STRA|nr:expressed unknown protein [Seminavis robusta]|eukprot:Sro665_g183880.1 n/a (719) ;mRNA; r:34949-37105
MLETITGNAKPEATFLSTPRSMMPGSWACDSPRVFVEPPQKPMPLTNGEMGLSIQIPHLDENNNVLVGEARDAAESTARGEGEEAVETPSAGYECDYDKNPTDLFLNLQKKEWAAAEKNANGDSLEARTWVTRKEKHGKLRWRLLPLHAAIIFKAPEKIVESLLAAYPKGAQSKDDQGMLPLHLAFRHGSSEGTVNLLLVAFPQSVNIKDRKGRIPLVLAQASASPNRDAFVRALERGPTYYANAAAATERAAVTAEQRAIFDSKLIEVEKKHQQDVNILKEERNDLHETVETLQKELAKQKGATQVLVDHVNSLEAQLKSKGETERFLAVKAATLDTNLKEVNDAKAQKEEDMENQIAELKLLSDKLKRDLDQSNKERGFGKDSSEYIAMKEKNERHEKELKSLKMDWASAQARAAVLEAQLKSKIENEHELASQVSQLAGKLAESAADNGNAATMYTKRVQVLEEEREKLRATVNDLGKKLLKVSHFMNKMTLKTQETTKKNCEEARMKQLKLLEDATNHEQLIRNALEERKHMANLLKKQEAEMERSAQQHQEILEKLAELKKKSAPESEISDDDIPFSNSLTEEMQEVMSQVMYGMPQQVPSEESDDMVNSIMECVAASASDAGRSAPKKITLEQVLNTSSSDDEDPQKCLEDALRALELSRTKSLCDSQVKSLSVSDGGSLNFNPSDEASESDFKRAMVQHSVSECTDDDEED